MPEWRAMREWCEYFAAWTILKFLELLPRPSARAGAAIVARMLLWGLPRLRRTAMTNLRVAFPDWTDEKRRGVIRGMTRNLGWMAAEFAHFPKLSRENIEKLVVLDGFENFDVARRLGKGVLFLTGHMSAWELAPFAQALYGYPLSFLARPIDNWRVNRLIDSYRCLSGNRPIEKNNSARATLRVLRDGGTVGVLADQNTSVDEGVFVNFFGIPAATTTGLVRMARHTGATVVPGFLFWDDAMRKYRLRFEPAVVMRRTEDEEEDIRENTARCNKVIEDYIRAHPEQWLWVHKRWKNRPPGEASLYSG
ncbi:MAG: lysophospholipid acyltransferase family protein [Candidatus Acidiferrales bacterium]